MRGAPTCPVVRLGRRLPIPVLPFFCFGRSRCRHGRALRILRRRDTGFAGGARRNRTRLWVAVLALRLIRSSKCKQAIDDLTIDEIEIAACHPPGSVPAARSARRHASCSERFSIIVRPRSAALTPRSRGIDLCVPSGSALLLRQVGEHDQDWTCIIQGCHECLP